MKREEVPSYKYFNGDEDDVFDIMVELTGKQVHECSIHIWQMIL